MVNRHLWDFVPGMLIRCTSSEGNAYKLGETYEVKSFHPDGSYSGWGVIMTVVDSKGSTSNGWSSQWFEPAGGPW